MPQRSIHLMKRRTAREKALQALFQIDMSQANVDDAIENVLENHPQNDYLTELVIGVDLHKRQIDEIIKSHLEKWSLDRLATVDRNLLRIAVFELLYKKDEVPANVVLDEAIEIAKVFGDDQSSRFVNGVLSKIKEVNS
jgi:transcription antitermination protein NusB